MNWVYEKFKGDMAIYSICPKCNFVHQCGEVDFKTGEYKVNDQYVFCPLCGTFLYDENESPDVSYNTRDMSELYKMKYNITVIEHAIEEGRKNDFE